MLGRQPRARAAMQEQHRHAIGIAHLLPVQGVQGVDRQHAVTAWRDAAPVNRWLDRNVGPSTLAPPEPD